jgi:tripartite-type tricarboxylate transporter receptor subunit TctC
LVIKFKGGIMTRIRRWRNGALVAVVLLGVSPLAPESRSQEFPSGPLTWIVPVTAGGAFDSLARGVSPALSQVLGVPVIVKNIPGAEGYNHFYRSKPDGQTVGMVDVVGELAQALVRKQVYDVSKFAYLGRINSGTNLFVAWPKSPFKKIEDLKKAKEPVRCASFGGISTPTLECILISARMGFPLTIVRFPGPAEAIVGVVRGDADIATLGATLWLDHIAKGNVIPFLLWADQADARVPGVPSLKDFGLEKLKVATVQRSVATSPGTPPARVQALSRALEKSIKSDQVQKFLLERKLETDTQIGDAFRQTVLDILDLLKKHEAVIKNFVKS